MKKRLINDAGELTAEGRVFAQAALKRLRPLLRKYVENGYHWVDVQHIVQTHIHDWLAIDSINRSERKK
jgi:hypothetical protein